MNKISSTMRMTGLASGMNIDDMVTKLMQAHRMPMNKLVQKKQILEWQRDDYRSMNSKLLELRNNVFNMRLSSTFSARKAASSDEASVSVTGTASATEGIYSLQVKALAEAASLRSTAGVGAKVLSGVNTKLSDLNIDLGPDNETTLTIGGEKGTASIVVKSGQSIDEVVKAINNQANTTGVKVSFDANLDRFFFVSSNTGLTSKVSLRAGDDKLITDLFKIPGGFSGGATEETFAGDETFTLGSISVINSDLTTEQTFRIKYGTSDYDFKINKETTIGTLIRNINGSDLGKLGVSAHLDSNNKLVIYNPDDSKPVVFEDATGNSTNILENLGLDNPTHTTGLNTYKASITGQDAEVDFNGVTGFYSTNSFQINGMNVTAKAVMATAATITVTQDTDAVFKTVKGFVDKYNEILDTVNGKLTEKRYRDFLPLTEEQRKELKDDDIERWEEKAKSGLLRSDLLLTNAMTELRQALGKTVDGLPSGAFKNLSDIGITSGSWQERGRLYIDETKLRKAIAEKPEEIIALFTSNDGVASTDAADGYALRLSSKLDAVMEKLRKKAGTTTSVESSYLIGKDVGAINKQMDRFARRLDDLETRYYKQFTAMESHLNKMNMQGAYLAQQFSGGR